MLSLKLRQVGYTVRTAVDSDEGLRLYEHCGSFKVVLINYDLPTIGGLALATSILKRNQSQRVVITAFDYASAQEVPALPKELAHIPVLTDPKKIPLRKALESSGLTVMPYNEQELARGEQLLGGCTVRQRDLLRFVLEKQAEPQGLDFTSVQDEQDRKELRQLEKEDLIQRDEDHLKGVMRFLVNPTWVPIFQHLLFPRREYDKEESCG